MVSLEEMRVDVQRDADTTMTKLLLDVSYERVDEQLIHSRLPRMEAYPCTPHLQSSLRNN